jgi:hypothetical protein
MFNTLRVRILGNDSFIKHKINQYSDLEFNQAMAIFFPTKYNYKLVNKHEQADICIIGIQHENNVLIRDNEFNILISIENLSIGRNHYKHFNLYNRYNNNKIQLYYYNDINFISHNSIPISLCFIRQFNCLEYAYKDILNTKYENKRFCLTISKNNLNTNKRNIIQQLSKIGKVDHISLYNNILLNKSCYSSIELLKVFNRYKFVVCIENSKTSGYITEKIFNVFLSKSIPIYDGAPNILNYIDQESLILYDSLFIKKIMMILNNKELYDIVLNKHKINSNINIDEFDKNIENIFDKNLQKI